VDVLGHEDVAEYEEPMLLSEPFEDFEEVGSGGVGGEVWEPVITTEGEEVVVTFRVVTLETARHGSTLLFCETRPHS
jgi:hypothetical protein